MLEKQEQPQDQSLTEWDKYFEKMRTARLQRRSDVFQQKRVICRTNFYKSTFFLIVALPAIALFFYPATYLFTDSEYYDIHVSSIAKCCVFFLISVILVYYFRSHAIIIEDRDNEYQYWYVRVSWIIIYSVTISVFAHGHAVLCNLFIHTPQFNVYYCILLVISPLLAFTGSSCLFFCCSLHWY